jgi:Rieske Fe-S protein
MNRKEFVVTCVSCLGAGSMALFMQACVGTKYYNAAIEGPDLIVPLSAFTYEQKGEMKTRNFVVAYNDRLEYPVGIYRFSENEFSALLMRCTHQGTELQAFGDRLQCPAHGSEFSNRGLVQNGPADTSLRTFPVTANGEQLRINLS